MTEQEKAIAVGQEVKNLLNLKIGKDGLMKTTWGTKTIEGLGRTILRIVEEAKTV